MNASRKFDENNYEFNQESRDGVYIIHGFTNTTYEVKELAIHLSQQGFHARADNLPGHGTTVEDCNRHKHTDWIEAVEQGVAEMISQCDNVNVIGISMGSVLALHISSIFNLNAAVFASPTLNYNNNFSVHVLAPLLHRLFPFRDKRKTFSRGIRSNLKFFGYDVWPNSAVNEMRKLTNRVKKILPQVKCPAMVMHSRNDLLSPQSNFSLVYDSIQSNQKEKLILEKAGHNLFAENPEQKMIFEKVSTFLKKFNK